MTGVCPELIEYRSESPSDQCCVIAFKAAGPGRCSCPQPQPCTNYGGHRRTKQRFFFLHKGPATCIRIGTDQYFMLAMVVLRVERMTRAEGEVPED